MYQLITRFTGNVNGICQFCGRVLEYHNAKLECQDWTFYRDVASAPTCALEVKGNAYVARLRDLLERALYGMATAVPREHSPWCNGVHAEGGACEGDYMVSSFIEEARQFLEDTK